MRVLVIEDEAALQQDIAQQLRQSGYAVDVAGDGGEPAVISFHQRGAVAVEHDGVSNIVAVGGNVGGELFDQP